MPDSAGHIGVVGAGVMGSEIALVAALAGFDVVLRDQNARLITAGINHASQVAERMVSRGRLDAHHAERRLAHIVPATDEGALQPCTVVIEAVPERMDIKRGVFRLLGRATMPGTVLASNTSGLSITALGEAAGRPRDTIGLHFFNPPSVMQLVEVIRGEATSAATLAEAIDTVQALGRTPVVVRECPGFLVNRILLRAMAATYRETDRTDADLAGVDAHVVAHGHAPMGPFALGDLVGLDTMAHIQRDLAEAYGDRFDDAGVLARYVKTGRLGRKSGEGFFEGPVTPHPHIGHKERAVAHLFYAEARDEAHRCAVEGVASPADVETAMRLGAGWTGSPLSP